MSADSQRAAQVAFAAVAFEPEVEYRRHECAAHYPGAGERKGHDLECWTYAQPAREPSPTAVPADAEFHHGFVDHEGAQCWVYTRRAPLSGSCARCRKLPGRDRAVMNKPVNNTDQQVAFARVAALPVRLPVGCRVQSLEPDDERACGTVVATSQTVGVVKISWDDGDPDSWTQPHAKLRVLQKPAEVVACDNCERGWVPTRGHDRSDYRECSLCDGGLVLVGELPPANEMAARLEQAVQAEMIVRHSELPDWARDLMLLAASVLRSVSETNIKDES